MNNDLDSLSIRQKIGQLFFIGIPGAEVDLATRQLLDDVKPGGICLFARNIREALQTRRLLDGIREAMSTQPLLSIDQEGGLVDRLRRVMSPMPAASKLRNPQEAARSAALIVETLRILGFNMDFAPVVDVVDNERSTFSNGLASRTFGRSPEDVAASAGAFLRSLQENGILGCLKHFPGLGAAEVDSHEELPEVRVSEAELISDDLRPYRELLASDNVYAVMVAHACFPNVNLQEKDQNGKLLPSSLSYNFVTALLRRELAFDGLVITDDLEMGAIINNYGIGDACKMAVAAGVDMLAICADPAAIRDGYQAVLKAVTEGEIGMDRIEQSIARIARIKKSLSPPMEFDPGRLDEIKDEIAEFNEQLGR